MLEKERRQGENIGRAATDRARYFPSTTTGSSTALCSPVV
jgi:hypothetical protein